MVLTLYVDLLSQPARALVLFVRKNNIPHELVIVNIQKGEHKDPEYVKNIHRFGKIPAIDDDGFRMIESIAIFRYLARKYDVPDHWYPKDIQKQAKVDEFLEWHHLGERAPIAMFYINAYIKPVWAGKKMDEKIIEDYKIKMEEALDEIENIWLKNSLYLVGDTITIADLIGICEIEQPRIANYDASVGRPRIKAWMKRVKDQLQPDYDEIIAHLDKIAK